MRKPIPLTIIALTLLAAVSRQDSAPLVDLIAVVIAIPLYLIAVVFLVAVAVSPLVGSYAIWLYIGRRRGHPLPAWTSHMYRHATRRCPALARITAAHRAATRAWKHTTPPPEPTAAEATSGQPDTPATPSAA
jgi:hypothetical protein